MFIPTTTLTQGGGSGGLYDAYAYLRDEKANNTGGGSFTSGAWQTRDLNTEVFDTDNFVSVASNQFTLQAGTYFIIARAPAFGVDRHKIKLRDITAGADAGIGASMYVSGTTGVNNDSWLHTRVTIAGATVYEIQHQCTTTQAAANARGVESNFSVVEVYTEVWIWRES